MFSKKLFNNNWEFSKQKIGTGVESLGQMDFERVNLPHDWLIYQTADLYESATGFYRKKFDLKKRDGRRYEIYFEGVYMDSSVFVNGVLCGEWKYGYSSFFFDITENLQDGENQIVVMIRHVSPNTRWYSGAGIFRDVYFIEQDETHIVTDSLYVSAKPAVSEGEKILPETDLSGEWEIRVSAEIVNGAADSSWNEEYDKTRTKSISPRTKLTLWFPTLGKTHSALIGAVTKEERKDGVVRVEFTERVEKPQLWSLDDPKLYDCVLTVFDPAADYSKETPTTLKPGEPTGDKEKTMFGFRSFTFDTDRGFFVNGEHVKINGVCEHHDLGALGAAFNKTAMRRKYMSLRTMGINAIRTAHNMPAVGLLDLADELGFLVLDEAFDMWESSKTEFDYARFFIDWHERDVRSWIRRDRNHPSIFMWSIGNEIYDTHKDAHGEDITRYLQKGARENDYYENAVIGMGSNYMPWEGAQRCADILKFAGYNYAERLYNDHHEKHKDWYIFGSETSSTVQSRGIYHFPYSQSTLADEDMQCSSLGNSTTSWGAVSSEYCIIAERDHDFSIGQFLWTGFDYIGEPTPYHTRNSYFGQLDTAGFPKDSYYVYKSAWTDHKKDPFVHVFPYWDFNEGQQVDVRIATNAPEAELFVNGKSMGRQKIDHAHGQKLTADYIVTYEKGEITAVAYDDDGKEIARQSRKSFGDSAALKLDMYEPDRKYTAGCGDMAFIEVSAEDAEGNPVENACDLVDVKVEGAGYLAGLDNGDSTDSAEYKGYSKRLFSGKMLILVSVGKEKGEVKVSVSAKGLKGAEVSFNVEGKKETEGISLEPENYLTVGYKELLEKENKKFDEDEIRIRKIELTCDGDRKLSGDNREVKLTAKVLPAGIDPEKASLIWKAVNSAGIDSNIAKVISTEGNTAVIKVFGDGDFKVRCMAKCGCEAVKVSSELGFTADGVGEALLDPYGFIAGGLFSYSEGELGNGNEHGISTQRCDRTVFGFENINFGDYGSDEITVPLFVLSGGEFPMQIWEGIPGQEGSECLADVVYNKPAMWNTYQSETYKLKRRVKGITALYFVTYDKAQFAGFSFKKLNKAYELLYAGECDSVYGDSFEKKPDRIDNIGNNVTVEFKDMNFTEGAVNELTVCGLSHIPLNTVHVIFAGENGEKRDILEFTQEAGKEQTFAVSGYEGKGSVRFVFLPGTSFDFYSIRFKA